MYVTHYDYLYCRWNVFQTKGEQENYIISFDTLLEAQAYCREQNALEVEMRR